MELAQHAADLTLSYLKRYRRDFKQITRQAQTWFENRAWLEARDGLRRRTNLYSEIIRELENALRIKMGKHFRNRELWILIKAAYSRSISNRADEELSETFFNSLTRSVFKTIGIDRELEFIWLDSTLFPTGEESLLFYSLYHTTTLKQLFENILLSCPFTAKWKHISRDATLVAQRVEDHLQGRAGMAEFDAIDVVEPILYRGRSAYILARIRRGHRIMPLVLSLLHSPEGIHVDAVILSEAEVSTIFSFTRSYFLVDIERPVELVGFLKGLLSEKPLEEIYISLGFTKHGKTVRYRGLYSHLERSLERFEIAPGAKGMVMAVFHLPSYHLIFKVIRDKFAAPKTTTRERVHQTYKIVEAHDRVGRLVDAQAFDRLQFPKRRFAPKVLTELLNECSQTVRETDSEIIIEQLYVERKVYPLNLYVHDVEEQLAHEAVIDHGQSIRDLASVGLFPGDLLVKNFGVTRRGRVVFYDYDEIILLSECRFKRLPTQDIYTDEPIVVADERDIFPEEFRHFIWGTPKLRQTFEAHHSDLFTVEWWRDMQQAVAQSRVSDIFPYSPERRLYTD